MKVKVIDKLSYQTFPIFNDYIEVDESDLDEIGKTKCFNDSLTAIIDYVPIVETPTETYEEIVERKIRDKYTLSEELALLRQKDSKPSEYQAYYYYCELCKTQAKAELGLL